ncbi:MAG: VanW family protein [Saccharofermentans sp.]|jgi:vancomycin resistance protein YoaR|nr:VanW family protein [Mageeibacillus sp.]MCI1263920.1 VanW family protein [Saccharofermentans sp.]MCI1275597.1 VanW family protein [Saccharofermentans sp.]MCI1768861.1 VanW family protein [Mageeibacillus sp.]
MKKTSGSSAGKVRKSPTGAPCSSTGGSRRRSEDFDYGALGTAQRSARKHSGRKRRSGRGKKALAAVACVLAALVVIFGVLHLTGNDKPIIDLFRAKINVTMADGTAVEMTANDAYAELATDTIYNGIVIDGQDVGGMTKDEALAAVAAVQPEAPVSLNISLALDGETYPLDLSSLALESNMSDIVDEAYSYARPQSMDDLEVLTESYNSFQQLKNKTVEYTTAYTVNTDGLEAIVSSVLTPLQSEASDAYISSFNTQTMAFDIVPEKKGYAIDIDSTVSAVKAKIDSRSYDGSVDVVAQITEPQTTSSDINGTFGLRAGFSTVTSANSNRNSNINKACENINGTILNPGEEFSFNDVVGERTEANGFKEATVILGGQYEEGLGGGICQVSTTLYNAVVKADLNVTERNWHAWPSSYVDTGLDATVDYGNLDFKFTNNTDYQIIVVAYWKSSDSTVHCDIYGKRLPDGETINFESEVTSTTPAGDTQYVAAPTLAVGRTNTLRAAHDGITAVSYKVVLDSNGNEISREQYATTTYRAYSKKVEVGTLNPDGTNAQFDATTGTVITPVPTAPAAPPETVAPVPAVTETTAPPATVATDPTAST